MVEARGRADGRPHGALAVIVIDAYDDQQLQLNQIRAEVAAVTAQLSALGFVQETQDLVGDARSATMRERFLTWRPTNRRILVYWAGHGKPEGVDEFYLYGRETSGHPGTANAVAATEIGQWLADKDVASIVLIVDACNAGGGAREIFSAFDKRTENRSRKPRLAVIGAAQRHQMAQETVFARALIDVLFNGPPSASETYIPWGEHDAYLTPDELTNAIEEKLRRKGSRQLPECKGGGVGNFFPNPGYLPNSPDIEVDAKRQRSSWVRADIHEHFMIKFRGIDTVDERGWYFSGREQPLREIVSWLHQERSGLLVVTGPPGCGKSALLGRLAVLSHAGYRGEAEKAGALINIDPETDPLVGTITAGIHAKNKTLIDCVRELAAALEIPTPRAGWQDATQLVSAVRNRGEPITILLDALDEARPSDQMLIGDELLRGLADTGLARVLVGTRPERARPSVALTDSLQIHGGGQLLRILKPQLVVQLDDDPQAVESVSSYVRQRLNQIPGSPYAHQDERIVSETAWAIARQSQGIFLFGRLLARTLASRDTILDLTSDEARYLISGGVAEAFAADLDRYGVNRKRVRDLLSPLAWAEGAGLPRRRIWLELVNALSSSKRGASYTDADLAWLLENAGAYLIESGEDGQTVYRLYHQAFNDYLHQGEDEEAVQEIITGALLGVVEVSGIRDWAGSEPYLRRHLATHAAAAGWLDELVSDSRYLLYADPTRLGRVIGEVDFRTHPLARLYWRALYRLYGATPSQRAATLQITALTEDPATLAYLDTSAELTWRGVWASGGPSPLHRQLLGHTATVNSVTVGSSVADTLIVSGSEDGTVRVWNADTGRPEAVLSGHQGWVYSVAFGEFDGRSVIISGGRDGLIRVWDLETSGLRAELAGHSAGVTAVAAGKVAGEEVIVSGGSDHSVRIWDAVTGKIRHIFTGHTGPVFTVAIGNIHGRAVVVSGGHDGTVRLWDALTGDAGRIFAHDDQVFAVAVGQVDERSLVAVGGYNDVVYLYESDTDIKRSELQGNIGGTFSIAIGNLADKRVIVGGGTSDVRVWEAGSTQPRLVLHTDADEVGAVAIGQSAKHSLIISGGSSDGALRVWYPGIGEFLGHGTPDSEKLSAVASTYKDGKIIAASANDRHVDVWNMISGHDYGRIEHRFYYGRGIESIALEQIGDVVAVAIGGDNGVRIMDASGDEQLASVTTFAGGGVKFVDLRTVAGKTYVVVMNGNSTAWVAKIEHGPPWTYRAFLRIGERHELAPQPEGLTAVGLVRMADSAFVACGCRDGTMLLYSADTGQRKRVLWQHRDAVFALACGEVRGNGVIASASGQSVLLSRTDFLSPRELLTEYRKSVTRLAIRDIGGRGIIALARSDSSIVVGDADSGAQYYTIPSLGDGLSSMSLTDADGRALLTTGVRNRLQIVELPDIIGEGYE